MPAPTITLPPAAPLPTDEQSVFDSKAYAFVSWQVTFASEINNFISWIGADIDVTKTVRAPENLDPLPALSGRQSRYMWFDAGGNPSVKTYEGVLLDIASTAATTGDTQDASLAIVLAGINRDATGARSALNVQNGATANATNEQLRDRTTHTGSQPQSTVTNLVADLASKLDDSQLRTSLASPDNSSVPSTLTVASAIATAMAGETPMGAWNATTNTPALASSVGAAGHWYEVSVPGTTNLNGESSWQVGDKAIFNGIIWTRIPASGVRSFDGRTGDIELNFDNRAELKASPLLVGASVILAGLVTKNDGSGGRFVIENASGEPDNAYRIRLNDATKDAVRVRQLDPSMLSKKTMSSRAPTRLDFRDFSVITVPIWKSDDGIYTANRVGSNYATWVKDRAFRPLIGNISAPPDAIWWLAKAMNSYTGFCINVSRESDGLAIDVGFDSLGNLDLNTLDNFLRSTRGVVNTWYDQSGNGHHLTSTGAHRPVISSVSKVGNLRAIIFETGVIYNGATIPDQYMTIPNTLTGASNNVSMGCLCSLASSLRDAPIIELPGADGNYTAIGKRNSSGSGGFNVYQNSSLRVNSLHQPKISDNFFFASISSTTVNYWGNDTVAVAGTSLASSTWTGGKVGGTTNIFLNGSSVPQNGGAMISGLMIYKQALAVGLQRQLNRSVVERHGLVPQVRANIIFDGDSITEGASATDFDNTASVVNEMLFYGAKIFNVAQSGGTVETQDANRVRWETQIYRSGAPLNLIVLAIGTNNLHIGDSASTVYAGIAAYVNAVKSTGYEIVISSILPRASFISTAKETERLALNQLLKDNWLSMGAIGYINYDNEGTMGSNTFVTNTTYYGDGTHPTTVGYALLGTYVKHNIEPIIARLLARFY